jgi:hypothetical protein
MCPLVIGPTRDKAAVRLSRRLVLRFTQDETHTKNAELSRYARRRFCCFLRSGQQWRIGPLGEIQRLLREPGSGNRIV